MPYILDGIVVLVVLLGLFLGYRHGFVRTIVKLVGCVLALSLAATFSRGVAQGVFDQFLRQKAEDAIAGQVTVTENQSVKESVHTALAALPDNVQNLLDDADWVDRAIDNIDASGADRPQQIAGAVVTYIVEPVAIALLGMIAFLLLFVVLMIVVSLLARLIGRLLQLPGLRQIDGLLGAVLGTVEGIAMALVVVAVLQVAAASASDEAWLNRNDLDQTILVSSIAQHNPVAEYWNVL